MAVKQRQESRAAPASGDEIVVYTSRGKALGYALLGAALTGFLVIAALLGPTDLSGYRGSWFARLLVYLGTVMLFLLTVYGLFLVFSTTPRLIVTHEGIWVNSPFVFGTGIVGWSDMASIQAVRFRSLPGINWTYLVMLLRDRQALRAQQNTVQALLYWLSGYPLLWPRAVVVNDTLLRMSSRELLGRMQVRYGPELARYRVEIRGGGA